MIKKLTINNLHRIKGIQIYTPTINNHCTVEEVLGEESIRTKGVSKEYG